MSEKSAAKAWKERQGYGTILVVAILWANGVVILVVLWTWGQSLKSSVLFGAGGDRSARSLLLWKWSSAVTFCKFEVEEDVGFSFTNELETLALLTLDAGLLDPGCINA
ncbi:MAG: hypothetical protein M1511_07485 [Deltaproteobacteria bacterium]|nr:hypothetical protein [Deltaproteobacteria bacterium]